MTSVAPSFGDNVRIRATPETAARGVAGAVGQVYGFTTPSVTKVAVIGGDAEDFALNVVVEGHGVDLWLSAHLVEVIDHTPGTTISIDGVPKQWVRTVDGEWREEPRPPAPKAWWRFWR